MKSQIVTVRALHLSREPIEATIAVEPLLSSERVERALVRLGVCWFFAAVSVFVPLFHFVLVPTLFLAGPVLAILGSRTRVRVVPSQDVPCAKCAQPVAVGEGITGWPARLNCRSCSAILDLRPSA
ncbi:MAG: hypothetical protein HYV07_12675 [Deltaproteobacteria bacterium]|nr:hypothetical protein [Deltaproteobacteria bacterium]